MSYILQMMKTSQFTLDNKRVRQGMGEEAPSPIRAEYLLLFAISDKFTTSLHVLTPPSFKVGLYTYRFGCCLELRQNSESHVHDRPLKLTTSSIAQLTHKINVPCMEECI